MKRILIIEGNENTATYLASILKKENYFIKIANSGAQAFEDISSYQFNLIILDLILPDSNGVKVLTSIRKNFNPEHLPIVIISNITDEEKIAELLALGANDFIAQPFSEHILVLKLKNHLLLQQKNDELNKNNEVLKDVIENIPIISIIVNDDVQILNTNRIFSDQFDFKYLTTQKELLGNVIQCVHSVNSGGMCGKTSECAGCIIRNSVNETLKTGKNIFKREGTFHIKTINAESEMELQLSTTQIIYKNMPSVLLNINDITKEKKYLNELREARDQYHAQAKDLKQKEQILIEQKKQLQELNETKDKFLSIITHDLRNPFCSLLGFSEVLHRSGNTMAEQKREKYINFIYETSKNTYDLLEDLLAWTRSQFGKMEVNQQKLNLKYVAAEIYSSIQPLAGNKKLSLHNSITDDVFVFADENMLNTILRNLLTNAVKFTREEGMVTLSISLSENFAEVSVADTGIGMSDNIKNSLFKIGETQSSPGTEKEKGTGLGLILCKEFVEKQGGQIWVESELGKGSQFILTLPLWKGIAPNALP
ncbi:MAG TPA: hybrid sensor histidine kinase/response regulator [Bacteroidales bacterium]|nr:hybrid sensor histidine kinase/response regulator [Bacteroidales bacterium]